MRHLLFIAAALLLGPNVSLAQVSTMGTTAMGLSSTPGTIVTSPLNSPGPFSATTQPGALDTTLAPVPLASDPTIPGTVVTCSTPSGQIAPGTPAVPVTSLSSMAGTTGMTPAVVGAPTTSAVPANSATSTNGSTIMVGPTTSVFAIPAPTPQPLALQALPSPSITSIPVPTSSMATSPVPTSMITFAAPLGTIPSPITITTTGNIPPMTPLGSASTTVCSSTPGGQPTNGAALPLSTPEIPANPPPGTIQQDVTQLGATSIDATMAVMPTPNTSACAESMTMNLANPGTMAPANATGAAATPGVSPPGC
jgi:hypothetical protein